MKKLTYSLIGVLILTGITFSGCSGKADKKGDATPPVLVAVVSPVPQNEKGIVANGQIQSKEIARLGTRMMGSVTSIRVKKGDRVSKGQLLLTISDEELGAKKAQAEAMINEAEAAYRLAKKDEERFAILYAKKSVSAKEYENVDLQFQSMKSKLEMARQMKKEVTANQAYMQIAAPFAGIVSQIDIDLGALANPGVPLITVEKEGDLVVESSLTESDINKVDKGMIAIVRVKSAHLMFKAPIIEKSRSSVESGGQYKITIEVPTADKLKVYSGMYANVLVPVADSLQYVQSSNLLIPTAALLDKDGLSGVFVVSESQTAMLRWVRTGQVLGDQTEIISGLEEHDLVILPQGKRLENGVKVELKKEQ
ncbi:efflux RND transporter periplasmic adaptor subunit [uncultured Bacteroides sp.]|uniref:efflux RND transporter periplasmic adaptor subunit n=1 Tax=uncultured Bacteroides sp. TaxID=162156 RepID=UPI002AA834B5|nr:efflux RND transporter periplasmic adaptor subunit [uncultured Bacteroides sp.]